MTLAARLRDLADRLESDKLPIELLIQAQFAVSDTFQRLKPNRPWTPDGHMLGSIGETFAEERYGIDLDTPSSPKHDGKAPDGREVQVKITQGKQVGLSSEPEHLLVLRLHRNATIEEVYNGPGPLAWNAAGKMQKNGQRPITVSRLRDLQKQVPESQKISQKVASPSATR